MLVFIDAGPLMTGTRGGGRVDPQTSFSRELWGYRTLLFFGPKATRGTFFSSLDRRCQIVKPSAYCGNSQKDTGGSTVFVYLGLTSPPVLPASSREPKTKRKRAPNRACLRSQAGIWSNECRAEAAHASGQLKPSAHVNCNVKRLSALLLVDYRQRISTRSARLTCHPVSRVSTE